MEIKHLLKNREFTVEKAKRGDTLWNRQVGEVADILNKGLDPKHKWYKNHARVASKLAVIAKSDRYFLIKKAKQQKNPGKYLNYILFSKNK
jgi:hypothetical protein